MARIAALVKHWLLTAGCVVAVVTVLGESGVAAESPASKRNGGEGAALSAAESKPDSGKHAEVLGFRSARFGMDEAQVRQAIKADFPNVSPKDIVRDQNVIERTTFLRFAVDALLPAGGRAQINYIFGYQSQKLIQVNIMWGGEANRETPEDALINTANILRQHFQGKAFVHDSVLVNAVAPDGSIIIFRGSDADGRMALLVLAGEKQDVQGKPGSPSTVMRPTVLLLSYVKDPVHHDVFQIKPSDF